MSVFQALKHTWDVATGNNRIDELQLGLQKAKALSTIFDAVATGALIKGVETIHLFGGSFPPMSWGGVAGFAASFTVAAVALAQASSLYAAHKYHKNQNNGAAPQRPS
jgi:hypothetical protein